MEPKKACLTWLIMYKVIWSQMKVLLMGKVDGKRARCRKEEDDMHIFMLCKSTSPPIFLQSIDMSLGGGIVPSFRGTFFVENQLVALLTCGQFYGQNSSSISR